jgi:predicted alpha/beta-fold hydrolase
MDATEFAPPRFLDNPHLQSVLASHRVRRWLQGTAITELQQRAEHALIDCGDGVRLQGWYNAAPSGQPRGLVVLLHGWEGSALSSYLCSSAVALQRAGFAVFRLEFRDHGNGQHLNEGLFHSGLIDEVVGAIASIARRYPVRPLMLSGFSLGGNFALRVALRAPAAGIPLSNVVAVCPVVDPAQGLMAMERAPWFYQQYFLLKWRRSLRLKQLAFPQIYDFGPWMKGLGMRAMTRELIVRYSSFDSLESYLDGYSIAHDRLSNVSIPTTILTSEDDPIIPVADFRSLQLSPTTQLRIVRHGGHCGFLENWRLESWAERFVLDSCNRAASSV